MAEILDRYRAKCVRLSDERDVAQTKADRYLKRMSELVNRERENRRRISHLIRSLTDSVVKRRAQSLTLFEKDRKAALRNEEIRVLTEFKETMVTAFPDIEENITELRRNMSSEDKNNTPNMSTGDGLG